MLICKTSAMGSSAPMHIGTDAIEWANKSRLLGTTVEREFRKETGPNQEVQVFNKGCSY